MRYDYDESLTEVRFVRNSGVGIFRVNTVSQLEKIAGSHIFFMHEHVSDLEKVLFLHKSMSKGMHWKHLIEKLMNTYNICFHVGMKITTMHMSVYPFYLHCFGHL